MYRSKELRSRKRYRYNSTKYDLDICVDNYHEFMNVINEVQEKIKESGETDSEVMIEVKYEASTKPELWISNGVYNDDLECGDSALVSDTVCGCWDDEFYDYIGCDTLCDFEQNRVIEIIDSKDFVNGDYHLGDRQPKGKYFRSRVS